MYIAAASSFPAAAAAAKTGFYILTSTGVAGVAAVTFDSLSHPNRSSSSYLHHIRNAFNGVVRCSRALSTITANLVDYKYSLHGVSTDLDEYRTLLSEVHLRSAKRILRLCEVNRGFYVKAGQFIAALRQVPREYSTTLASLQDQTVPCRFEAIKEVLINNFGLDLSDIFLSIDEQPVAAASIAQVHRALLKNHQEVALKVQYPGLEDQMRLDITTMSVLARFVAWFFPEYRFQRIVTEFTDSIALELDFIQEARNSARTAQNLRNNSKVRVPHIFWDLTTSQVLTMEFCKGRKVDDLEFMKEMKIDPKKVAKVLMEVFAEMIFIHGFLHGDPHPGNVLVSPEGKGDFCLVLLDHGIYRKLDEEFRAHYCQLWKALILLDGNKIQKIGEHFGVGKYSKYLPLIFTGRTIDSKSALGKGMSDEEKKRLKQEVKSLTAGDVSTFMESLPSDFLTVLRTDGLLRVLTSKLGSHQRVRLLVYANYAVYGHTPKLDPGSGYVSRVIFTGFKSTMSYLKLRLLLDLLELLLRLEDTRQSFLTRSRHIAVMVTHLLEELFPFLPRILKYQFSLSGKKELV